MPRPRKALKFADILGPMDIADLKTLKNEASAEIRLKEREVQRIKSEQEALKIRDKIKIGQKVTFEQFGADGGSIKAAVIGIFSNKVQVEVEGRKKSVALTRIIAVG